MFSVGNVRDFQMWRALCGGSVLELQLGLDGGLCFGLWYRLFVILWQCVQKLRDFKLSLGYSWRARENVRSRLGRLKIILKSAMLIFVTPKGNHMKRVVRVL